MTSKQTHHKIKRHHIAFSTIALIGIIGIALLGSAIVAAKTVNNPVTTVSAKPVATTILANGTIQSQKEAVLHFQTGGKLVYLPVKEGDTVTTGETIAQLDTYALQRQLSAALNTYQSTRDTFDQTQQNAQTGVLQGQQKFTLDTQNKAGITGQPEVDIINDIAKRVLDQNQANLDNSVINVELANYAIQLATLTSPIDGIVTSEDVTTPYVNITPATSFVVADPNALVFRANVSATDINFITVGAPAKITLSGDKTEYEGTVIKLYPQQQTLPSGESVYQVDIASESLKDAGKLGQAGSVLIQNKFNRDVLLVPSWTVLEKQYIYVMQNNKPVLKKVTVGDTNGSMIEIMGGLSANDKIITNPKSVVSSKYLIF